MVEILNNPVVRAAVQHEQTKDQLASMLAERLMGTKTWDTMTEGERKICVRHVVSQVESEEELEQRLRSDFGLTYVAINWHLSDEGDQTGDEARMLVKAFGGLVSKNGALVMVMTADDMF